MYDGLRRLRSRAEFVWIGSAWYPNMTTLYVYAGRRVVQERNSATGPTVSYVRGLDLSGTAEGAGGIGGLLARSSGYQTNGSWTSHAFYHADGGGNVTFLSPSTYSGTMTRYSYDAYGRTTSLNGPLATANVYRFSSKELHAASGHYYYGYRFDDPQAQRWINRDPLGERGGVNLYGFVGNGPATKMDSFGLAILINKSGEPILVSGNVGANHGIGKQCFSVLPPGATGGGTAYPLPAYPTPEAAWLAYNDPMMRDPYPPQITDVDWFWPDAWPQEGSPLPETTKIVGDEKGPEVTLDEKCETDYDTIGYVDAVRRRGMEKAAEQFQKATDLINELKAKVLP